MEFSYKDLAKAEVVLSRVFKQAKAQNANGGLIIRKLAKLKKALLPAFEGEYQTKRDEIRKKYLDGNGNLIGANNQEKNHSLDLYNNETIAYLEGLKPFTAEIPEIKFDELFSVNLDEPITPDELGQIEQFFKE